MKRILSIVVIALANFAAFGQAFSFGDLPYLAASVQQSSTPPIVYDADVLQWNSNIVVQGASSVSSNTLYAANVFVGVLKASNIWTKITILAPTAGADLTASRYYLKYPSGLTNCTDTSFVSGDYVENSGLTGNGSTKYRNTGYNPSGVDSVSSFGVFIYTHTTAAGGTSQFSIGSDNGIASSRTGVAWLTAGTVESGNIAGSTAEQVTGFASSQTGFMGLNVSGSQSCQFYRNGSAAGTPVTQTGAFYSGNIFVHAANRGGTAGVFASRRLSLWVITTGLTTTDITNLYNAVQAFQTALGRNV